MKSANLLYNRDQEYEEMKLACVTKKTSFFFFTINIGSKMYNAPLIEVFYCILGVKTGERLLSYSREKSNKKR